MPFSTSSPRRRGTQIIPDSQRRSTSQRKQYPLTSLDLLCSHTAHSAMNGWSKRRSSYSEQRHSAPVSQSTSRILLQIKTRGLAIPSAPTKPSPPFHDFLLYELKMTRCDVGWRIPCFRIRIPEAKEREETGTGRSEQPGGRSR